MRKNRFSSIIVALLSTMICTEIAQAQDAYVVERNNTLTFYYDNERANREGIVYGMPNEEAFPRWTDEGIKTKERITKAVFDNSFAKYRPARTVRWFYNLKKLVAIDNINNLNTSEVTDMRSMFQDCLMLAELDLSGMKTDNVTDMGEMFFGCSGLAKLNLSNFNTANVTRMDNMFRDCQKLAYLDVSAFNTVKVYDMSGMFAGCFGLTNIDLSGFNTLKVTNMAEMFEGCLGLIDLNLSSFRTGRVTDMRFMFSDCSRLKTLNLSGFTTKVVDDMRRMFYDCKALNTIYCNETWMCYDSEEMFKGCISLNGATSYNDMRTDRTMANPHTGYFTKKVIANAKPAYKVNKTVKKKQNNNLWRNKKVNKGGKTKRRNK